MSSQGTFTFKLLQIHYPVVLSLQDYLTQICEPDLGLEKPDDLERYLSLVRTSYVALTEPLDALPSKKFRAGDVMSEMYEVGKLMRDKRVLKRLSWGNCRKVIDRVQVKLFERAKGKPLNVLTMGYRRAEHRGEHGRADMSRPAITNFFPNTNITALQALEWKILLTRIGEAAMYHLLLNANIFIALSHDCFCQLVGIPITELKPRTAGFLHLGSIPDTMVATALPVKRTADEGRRPKKRRKLNKLNTAASQGATIAKVGQDRPKGQPRSDLKRTPADIPFVRARIFYARLTTVKDPDSSRRRIVVGLPPNHVLHRLAPINPLRSGAVPSKDHILGRDTRHMLKHMFPRQFGLRHPFDATQGRKYNAYKFEDYTVREDEIQARGGVKTPKRLKPVLELVQQLIRRHWKCDYRSIRATVCPSKLKRVRTTDRQALDSTVILEMMTETSHITATQVPLMNLSAECCPSTVSAHGGSFAEKAAKSKPRFTEFMCSHNEVFRYVLKVTLAVIPNAFWGCQKNFKTVMKHVEQLVKGRRYETITLHSVLQGFSTQECDWLLLKSAAAGRQRPSVTDAIKRRQLVEEFLYWYFESFVIQLLRTTFYATESSAFRHQVLFFRQDDWAALCRPLLDRLAEGTFKRLDDHEAQNILGNRKLGYSFVRLLPKETGVRPIVNLRRRSNERQLDGSPALSINQILQAAFQILTYEKTTQPNLLGASVFGPNEAYAKLKTFKTRLLEMYSTLPKLYFVKVDVRTCFDSIEQGKLLEILQNILSEDGYMIQKYSCVFPMAGKIKRSFWKQAHPEADHPHFLTYAAKLAGMLRHAVFVDQVVYAYEDREEILRLLKEHVTENIVKIGQAFYRQIIGIPQGSVLSTILCSFFYGDMEAKVFKFTEDVQSMLCRLVDDYLFVTTEESKARKFLDMMNAGHPEYGCFVSAEKTLTNFDTDESLINRTLPGQKLFPWCGFLINMLDLSVSADYTRYAGTHIGDTLTVDRGRRPGAVFRHKMLLMAKHKSHIIFCDMGLNTERVVYQNVYQSFLLAAMKMCCYVRDWGVDLGKRDVRKFLLDTIHQMIRFSCSTLRSKDASRIGRAHGATCTIKDISVVWLGMHAFWTVLGRKGRKEYAPIVKGLKFELKSAQFAKTQRRWGGMVKEACVMLEGVKF